MLWIKWIARHECLANGCKQFKLLLKCVFNLFYIKNKMQIVVNGSTRGHCHVVPVKKKLFGFINIDKSM